MRFNRRKQIYRDLKKGIVISSLRSNSISENAVPYKLDLTAGKANAIEIYLRSKNNNYPQIAADIISNCFIRLTYIKENGTSATFGSSIIDAPSFRTSDGVLHLIPKVKKANLLTNSEHTIDNNLILETKLIASYDKLADLEIHRKYIYSDFLLEVESKLEFTPTRDIALQKSNLGFDSFRFFSISSMFASSTCYDANLIKILGDEIKKIELEDEIKRQCYLSPRAHLASRFQVINRPGRKYEMGVPGSVDSPSLEIISDIQDLGKTGVQAFLAESMNKNDDSLSVWSEWLDAPEILEKNKKINWFVKYRAFASNNSSIL